jgi:3-methylfumaryl-CoA hydratase
MTTNLTTWIGRTEECTDLITPAPLRALEALLDYTDPLLQQDDPLPPLWQWLYFLPFPAQSRIGLDGHPERGGFLPPIELPRRMWAGGRLRFHQPLRVGEAVSRVSTIADVNVKEGRSGTLVFVGVRHEISNAHGLAITEEQDIVYRNAPAPGEPAPASRLAELDHHWIREIRPDPVLLFRYSALTFNGHRIHYDRPYATEIEGYPGLVVHGPLIATLLLDLVQRQLPDAEVARFSFRAVKPVFDIAPFAVCGRVEADGVTVTLWAKDVGGALCMSAVATLASPP